MRSWDEIVALTHQMMKDRGPTLRKMRDIAVKYEGDYVLSVPEVPQEPNMPPVTPALIAEAIDKSAQRAASVEPTLFCPAIDGSKPRGIRSREYANIRKRAIEATYHASRWPLAKRRLYRQLSAYYTASAVVLPRFKPNGRFEMPVIEARDPLGTFAETVAENSLRPPGYVAFVTTHSGQTLRQRFPKARSENGGPVMDIRDDLLWDVVEWVDEEQTVFGLLGPVHETDATWMRVYVPTPSMMLDGPYPNRIGMMPAIVPSNVTLTRVASRIGTLLGNVELQAKLLTLDILAQERAIWPDMYVLGDQNQTPTLVTGPDWHDGRSGEINLVSGAKAIGLLHSTPDQRTGQIVDRLEFNFKRSAGLSPSMMGEFPGSLRSGRQVNEMLANSIDPGVQELHAVMEAWLPHMNSAILATYKAYAGARSFSMFTGKPGDDDVVEFVPNDHFETFDNAVIYPIPGADTVQTTQVLGSMYGAELISAETARELHPYIANPEAEGRKIRLAKLEAAMAAGIQQQVVSGAIPLPTLSMIHKYVQGGDDWFEAVTKADEAVRQQQATAPPPPEPGQVMAPQQAPGLAAPVQAAPPTQGITVPQGAEAMRQLQRAMRGATT